MWGHAGWGQVGYYQETLGCGHTVLPMRHSKENSSMLWAHLSHILPFRDKIRSQSIQTITERLELSSEVMGDVTTEWLSLLQVKWWVMWLTQRIWASALPQSGNPWQIYESSQGWVYHQSFLSFQTKNIRNTENQRCEHGGWGHHEVRRAQSEWIGWGKHRTSSSIS